MLLLQTTSRTAGSLAHSIEAKKSGTASPRADYASDGRASGPNSARLLEGSRTAPSSPGRVSWPMVGGMVEPYVKLCNA